MISGHYFEHMWFVNEQNVCYMKASVICSSKSNIAKITAPYWKPGESEEGDDITMTYFWLISLLDIDEIDF